MRKILSKLLILALSISIVTSLSLIGCKTTTAAETTAAETTAAETTAAETTAAEKLELSWMQWWDAEVGADLLDNIEAEFIKEHPGVTIRRENLPFNEYYNKVSTLSQAGQLPDVLGLVPMFITSFVSLGVLEPLDSRINAEGIRDQFVENSIFSWKGKLYGVPIYGGPVVIMCNVQMFNEAGVEYPTTWDEYIEVARKLTNPAKNQYATAVELAVDSPADFYWFFPLLVQAGGRLQDEQGNLVYNDKAGVAALEFLNKLYKENLLLPGTFGNTESIKRDAFFSGTIAMCNDGPWALPILASAGVTFPYQAVLMPQGPATRKTIAGGGAVGISSTSKNKDLAWEFVKFLTAGEGNRMWVESAKALSYYKPHLTLPYIQEDPNLQVFMKQVEEVGMFDPVIEAPSTLRKCLLSEIQKYLNGEKSAQQALDDSIVAYQDALKKGE